VWMSPDAPAHGGAEEPLWDEEHACWRMRAIGGLRTWLAA